MKRLLKIQQKLKAPKGERNNFGKYNYRTAEKIIEAVKPLLAEEELILILDDDLVECGQAYESQKDNDKRFSRNYIKATASLFDKDGKLIKSTSGFAELDYSKKGMDSAQITGSCSSYARKYAMCGLFAIDGNKDIDSEEYQRYEPKSKPKAPSVATIQAQLKSAGLEEHLEAFLQEFKVEKLEDLSEVQRNEFGNKLAATIQQLKEREVK